MSKKIGRPTLPKGEAKAVQLGVRFNPKDDKPITKLANDSGQTKSEWVRNAAIAESRRPPIWVKSKWQYEELQNKLVEFKLTAPTFRVSGVGKFLIRINPEKKLAIEICVFETPTPYKVRETRYWIGQEFADLIQRHPEPGKVDFRLLG